MFSESSQLSRLLLLIRFPCVITLHYRTSTELAAESGFILCLHDMLTIHSFSTSGERLPFRIRATPK